MNELDLTRFGFSRKVAHWISSEHLNEIDLSRFDPSGKLYFVFRSFFEYTLWVCVLHADAKRNEDLNREGGSWKPVNVLDPNSLPIQISFYVEQPNKMAIAFSILLRQTGHARRTRHEHVETRAGKKTWVATKRTSRALCPVLWCREKLMSLLAHAIAHEGELNFPLPDRGNP